MYICISRSHNHCKYRKTLRYIEIIQSPTIDDAPREPVCSIHQYAREASNTSTESIAPAMAPNETPRRKPLLVALAAKAPAIAPVKAPAAIEKHNP